MKALVRDRILGLDASGSQMGTYSPGNMLDDSTRNVWISSQYKDSITMECNTQVNSFFIGNVRSDDIRYSYFKEPITATSGQIENEGPEGGGDYVHFLLTLSGDKTGNNRPFSEGDNLRVRLASSVSAHVEANPVNILFEDYDKTANETKIYCSYQYDVSATFSTSQAIRNTVHNVHISEVDTGASGLFTTFKFATQSDKSRFLVAENSENVTEEFVHTIYWDGPSGLVTPIQLPSIPSIVQFDGNYGDTGTKADVLFTGNWNLSNSNVTIEDSGLENDPTYESHFGGASGINYQNNRWAIQPVTDALLAGTPNYSPYSPSSHYIRFTGQGGFEGVYAILKSHTMQEFQDYWDPPVWNWSIHLDSLGFNYTDYQLNAPDTNWHPSNTNLANYNSTSNHFLYKVSGDDLVSGQSYSFKLARSEMSLTLTSGALSSGDNISVSWEKSGEIGAGTGNYVVYDPPAVIDNDPVLSLEKSETLYTQYSTGDQAPSTSILAPNGLTFVKTATRVPVSGDQVVLETPPTVEFYQQDSSGNDLQDIKTATRFYRNLGDFVQGIFVDAVSVFVDVPYDDQPTKIEVKMTNKNDRRLNKAMYWFKDETEGSIVDVALTTPPSLSGTDGKLTIVEGSDHNFTVGDTFNLKHINHNSVTTLPNWSGDVMPSWYDEFDFNGEHIVTEVVDNTTYKSEKVIGPFSTVSQPWTSDVQRYRNQADDAWINIHSDRGGFTRGRLTETPVDIQSITYGNGTAQVSYSSPHGLVDGDLIIISGASNSLFNSTHQVLYVSSYTVAFSYNTSLLGSSGTEDTNLKSYKPIDLTEFGVIKVGSHLLFTNSDYIIESSQILSIRGTGTSEGDVKVRGNFPSTSLAKIYTPIFGGIVKAGYSFEFPNAQVGLSYNTKDYSVKKELATGAYHYLNRVTAKEFAGNILATPNEADRLIEFAKQQMGSPFAVNVLSNMNLNTTTSFYAYFATTPSVVFSNRLDNQRDVSFTLKEVL